jgi:hypothetical protein
VLTKSDCSDCHRSYRSHRSRSKTRTLAGRCRIWSCARGRGDMPSVHACVDISAQMLTAPASDVCGSCCRLACSRAEGPLQWETTQDSPARRCGSVHRRPSPPLRRRLLVASQHRRGRIDQCAVCDADAE